MYSKLSSPSVSQHMVCASEPSLNGVSLLSECLWDVVWPLWWPPGNLQRSVAQLLQADDYIYPWWYALVPPQLNHCGLGEGWGVSLWVSAASLCLKNTLWRILGYATNMASLHSKEWAVNVFYALEIAVVDRVLYLSKSMQRFFLLLWSFGLDTIIPNYPSIGAGWEYLKWDHRVCMDLEEQQENQNHFLAQLLSWFVLLQCSGGGCPCVTVSALLWLTWRP